MKALSIKQPWASLIASGRKTIELRSWRTHYRGPLVICAGSRPWKGLKPDGPLGVTVGVVELVDVRLATHADANAAGLPDGVEVPDGWYAWCLDQARPVAHVPVKGRLGIFDLPVTTGMIF